MYPPDAVTLGFIATPSEHRQFIFLLDMNSFGFKGRHRQVETVQTLFEVCVTLNIMWK